MAGSYDLSFCIPTYNFGKFLPETLESIVAQADNRVQIVIVDGASTDNTPEIVAQWQQRFPHIKYVRRAARCGVDPDILETVKQADGEYCWLFSADDILAPHAISLIRSQMKSDWNVWLTNFGLCDIHMNRLERHKILAVEHPTTFDWSHPAQRKSFFDLAETSSAFFSFISGIVVRRADWMSVPDQTEFIGSCWIIAAQLFALARDKRLVVRYDPGEALLKRGENDSFLTQGMIRRLDLAITGFRRVAQHYFGSESAEFRAISRVMKQEIPGLGLLHYRMRIQNRAEIPLFHKMIRTQFADGTLSDWLWWMLLVQPTWVLKTLRFAQQTAKRLRRGNPTQPLPATES